MKHSLVLLALCSFVSHAQYTPAAKLEKLDLKVICKGKSGYENSFKKTWLSQKSLMVMDNGFCAEFNDQQEEIAKYKDDKPDQENRWKIRFYASHSFTQYFNTDVTFKSTRYSVEIKDYKWAERSSREFFNPKTWKEEGNNPFQLIDEPSNTFAVSMEKDGHEFFFQAFHPKFVQANDQVKFMEGTIDGVWVSTFSPVNQPFDGYNQSPGESELVRNENTHWQMTFEIGYGHRFNLLKGKAGSINYIPSVGIGVMVGRNYTVMIKEDEWWEFDDYQDPYGIQGFGGSITNRLEFNGPKEKFGIFYENKLSYYRQNHGFLDGTQKYNLSYMGNSVGVKFMIYNPKNHKNHKKK